MNAEEAAGLVKLLRFRSANDPVSADAADLIEELYQENARLFEAADRRLADPAQSDPERELLEISELIGSLGSRLDVVYPKLPPDLKRAVDDLSGLEQIGTDLGRKLRREIEKVEPIRPRSAVPARSTLARDRR